MTNDSHSDKSAIAATLQRIAGGLLAAATVLSVFTAYRVYDYARNLDAIEQQVAEFAQAAEVLGLSESPEVAEVGEVPKTAELSESALRKNLAEATAANDALHNRLAELARYAQEREARLQETTPQEESQRDETLAKAD